MRAAGLPENVFESPPAYAAAAIQLGRDAAALQRLRQHVLNSVATAPLFDLAARTKHLETAWQEMARRANAGLRATAFDVAI